MKNYRTIITIILTVCIITAVNIICVQISAIEGSDMVITELKPHFSALNINIGDSLIISYEDIYLSDYQCSISSEGINASIIENTEYLQCEIEAIEDVEFGELTVSAIAEDGTELTNTIYTYNNGEKLFYSEFAKDQAWYDGIKEWLDEATDWLTYKRWEEEYSKLMSSILSGSPSILSTNNATTTISGNIEWEFDDIHPPLPLRNAYVEIIVKNDFNYTVLDSGFTDVNGRYNLEISNDAFSQYSDIYFRINLESHTFKVRSGWHTFAYYFDQKLSEIINAGANVEFNPDIKFDESMQIYRATYVHQSMVIAERFAEEMGFESTTKIRVAYPAGNKNNENDEALSKMAFCWGNGEDNSYCAIGWYSYNNTQMIVHEYSHYVQAFMGIYGEKLYEILLEWPTHDPNIDLYSQKKDKSFAMHLTWTEGWGYAFSVMAQRYYESEYAPLTHTNYDTSIPTSSSYSYKGEFEQQSVESFLWSLIDMNTVSCTINTDGVALDYQLPWTPQEWWNMTTVSGTCRLPDFIDLIESESYNLGVDIDYKHIKQYIAEKLTMFNIAPEVTSAIPGAPNASPVIKWIPNGSENYPNNLFKIKVFDENNTLLYSSDVFACSDPINTGYQIDTSIWNNIISGKDCLTNFYISVEGYRTDPGADEEDSIETSGPYASKYYLYQLNTAHDYSYIPKKIDDTTNDANVHQYICNTCNFVEELDHVIKSDDTSKYSCILYCDICNYQSFPNHSLVNIPKDDGYHTSKCQVCDYEVEVAHTKQLNSDGYTYHIYTCTECDYSNRVAHNIEYTTDGSKHTRYCTECDYSETDYHTFSYEVIDSSYHVKVCYCGATQGSASSHVWTATDLFNTVKCKHCGYLKILGNGEFVPIIKTKIEIEEDTE